MHRYISKLIESGVAHTSRYLRVMKRLGTSSNGTRESLPAVFLLRAEYQDPYVKRMAAILKETQPERSVSLLSLREKRSISARWRMMLRDHGALFHAHPFATDKFPATQAHLYLSHGLDNGRFDTLGTFATGPGRVLSKSGERLYSAILNSSPWGARLALRECPIYAERIFVTGDRRADEVVRLGPQRGAIKAAIGWEKEAPVIGLFSSHGEYSTFRWLGNSLVSVVSEISKYASIMLFFHPFERLQQPELFEAITKLASSRNNIMIVPGERFEVYLAACDALIGDYNSTSLYFSLLGRPVVNTPFPDELFIEDSPGRVLKKFSHGIMNKSEIVDLIKVLVSTVGFSKLSLPPEDFRTLLYPTDLSFNKAAPKALQAALVLAGEEP